MSGTFIDRFLGMFSTDMGIDLGTANTLVCVAGDGVVLGEPSVVALHRDTGQVVNLDGTLAVGDHAKDMLEKCPGNIRAVRPLKDGVIADFEVTEAMLSYFIQKAHGRRWFVKPRVVISIPIGITNVEKRAVTTASERAGARDVFLVDQPFAAAIGAGLPVDEPIGSMVVDIGGGTTDVAVISLAGVVVSKTLRVAGDQFDRSIIDYLREAHSLRIGVQTAERVKIQIGSAFPLEEEMSMEVRGQGTNNMPARCEISSVEVREALLGPIGQIVNAIREVLETTPPELAADLVDRGVTMAGGSSLLRGIDQAIMHEIDLPVSIADDPLTAVARGTGFVLDRLDVFAPLLQTSEET